MKQVSLNAVIARKLGIPHLGYRIHLLNIDSRDTKKDDAGLVTVCKEAHKTHISINNSTKAVAMLENAQNAVYNY